jgi:hypothetical protein
MTGPVLRAIKEKPARSGKYADGKPGGKEAAPLLPWVDEVFAWRVLWQDLGRLSSIRAREWELIEALRRGSYDVR